MNEPQNNERYVVVGYGWVGQANAIAFHTLGKDVAYFDPGNPPRHYPEHAATYDAIPALASVRDNDGPNTWYFVCVGDRVSDTGEQDLSSIAAALESLKGVEGKVVLRSTIIPDSLAQLPFDCYVPEFLHEKYAIAECLSPHIFVIGKKDAALVEPTVFAHWRERASRVFKGTPREAASVKYLSNIWNALQIAFVNEFGDAVGTAKTQEEVVCVERIIDFIFEGKAYRRYGRAFGGHCLPKDTRAFMGWAEKRGITVPLIKGMYESNQQHEAYSATHPHLREWFSAWTETHMSGKRALKELLFSIKKNVLHPQSRKSKA